MKTSFHGSFSLSCSFPHPSFASRRYFSVLIAPLFAIFVLHDALPGCTRESGRKSSREESDEKWGEEKSFRRSSSPLHSRALRRRFSDALHLFIGTRTGLLSSLSLSFFEFPGLPLFTPLIVLRVRLQTRRGLSRQECNFCNDFFPN